MKSAFLAILMAATLAACSKQPTELFPTDVTNNEIIFAQKCKSFISNAFPRNQKIVLTEIKRGDSDGDLFVYVNFLPKDDPRLKTTKHSGVCTLKKSGEVFASHIPLKGDMKNATNWVWE